MSVILVSHLRLSSLKTVEGETEMPLASGFSVEDAAFQHVLDIQTLKLRV